MTSPDSEASPTILFGHDVASRACDLLMAKLARIAFAGNDPQIEEIGSLEAAWEALDRLSGRRGCDPISPPQS